MEIDSWDDENGKIGDYPIIDIGNLSFIIMIIQKNKSRFCLDLHEINSKMKIDKYIISYQNIIFQILIEAILFILLNINKDYHQIDLDGFSRMLIIFIMKDGFWEFIHILFELKNVSTHFQWMIDHILDNFRFDFILIFIDDIVVFSKFFDDYLRYIKFMLDALFKIGMILDEAKCHFCYKSIEFLDHRVNRFGLSMQIEKIIIIIALPFSRIIDQIMEILEIFNYYHEFIDQYTEIAHSFTQDLIEFKKKIIHRIRNSSRSANLFSSRRNSLSEFMIDDNEFNKSSISNYSIRTI